ncbi:hypothetical protein ES705_33892 [subsurface metagenome]
MKWTPDLIIALAMVVGGLVLLGLGIDGEVKSILAMAAGWAFGSQYQVRKTRAP